FVVSASDTPPAAISAAFGVYVALSADALGLNVPAPPLQVAVEAPPPTAPASCTCGLLAHTVWSAPASAVPAGLIVIVIASLTAPHGPAGASVVRVSVTLPAGGSSAVGVGVAVCSVARGMDAGA